MIVYLTICLVSLIGAGLTLFSGFGLGTLLTPIFSLFFPIDLAITLTAIVHLLNNLFKLKLFGKHTHWPTVIKFGIPSILAAFLGAYLLTRISNLQPLFNYTLRNTVFNITPIKLIIAVLIFSFTLFDLMPKLSKFQFNPKFLSIGGLLSGFFGGISGNQGALRSAFLIKLNLKKESFIATGVIIACFIDVSRLTVYSQNIFYFNQEINYTLVLLASLSAFTGTYIGSKSLKKITIQGVQHITAGLLILFSVLLALGIL